MSNALGAVLQGLERGAGMGLNMYQALNAEARAKRQEQFQIDRANRLDFESDRSHDTQMERYRVTDDHWERNFEQEVLKHNDNHEISKRQAAVQERQAATQEGSLALRNRSFQYGVDETERARNETQILTRANASLYGPDGQRLTGQALVERLNSDPQAMKDILGAAVVKGLIPEDRAGRYTGMRVVPLGDSGNFGIMVAGQTEDGSPIRAGGAPLTENGTTSPDDQVMVFNPDSLGMMLDPEGHRNTMRDNALLERDTESQRQELESRYERDIAGLDAQEADIQAQLEASEARLAELEANRPAPPSAREQTEGARLSRMGAGGIGARGFGERGSAEAMTKAERELKKWEADYAEATEVQSQARGFLAAAPGRREQMGEIRTNSLADIQSNAERSRIEGGYATRSAERQASTAARRTAAVESGTKAIDTAVKAHNAHGEKEYGEKFNSRLNQNEIRVEFGRLDPDIRAALVAQPGGIEYAVDLMGAIGVTSFDYAIDTMRAQVNRDAYMDAVKDPALVTAGGGDPDVMHGYAMAYAEHKQRYPKAPKEASLQAITSGREPPKGK